MIAENYITEWRQQVPWLFDTQIEQDLIISRALIELFSRDQIANALAFRGGTALYKLFVTPAPRFSEDIDLVQINAEPIGEVLSDLRAALDPLLGEPRRKFGQGRVTITYKFNSESAPPTPLKLKIEINTREHFNVLGLTKKKFNVASSWFSGDALIPTFQLDELLGTKLRALFQKQKGRDLFDLWYSLKNTAVNSENIVKIFYHYLEKQNLEITRAQFQENLSMKLLTDPFLQDVHPILAPDLRNQWNPQEAFQLIGTHIFPHLRGEDWKGCQQ